MSGFEAVTLRIATWWPPPLVLPACRPTFGSSCMLTHLWFLLHADPPLVPPTCRPTFGSSCLQTHLWFLLHADPPLVPPSCRPTFGSSCLQTHLWFLLQADPPLVPPACRPTFGSSCMQTPMRQTMLGCLRSAISSDSRTKSCMVFCTAPAQQVRVSFTINNKNFIRKKHKNTFHELLMARWLKV